MKKLFTSVFVISAIFCLKGCSAAVNRTEKCKNNLNTAFCANMELCLDRLNAEGNIKRLADGEWEAEFGSPNTLSGVCLKFSKGNVTASYKGLAFSVPKSALPAKAMLVNLIEAVDSAAKSEELKGTMNEDKLEICGSLECGDYTITVDENGCLSAFSMPNNLLKIAFSDVKQLTVAEATKPVTTETTCPTTAAETETAANADAQAAECITPQEENNNQAED